LEVKPELDKLSLGSILFRQWDRINRISEREFNNSDNKINTVSWAIRMFRVSIPDSIVTDEFKTKEKEIMQDHLKILQKKKKGKEYSYIEDFENNAELFALCINLLADKGILYNKVAEGTYDD